MGWKMNKYDTGKPRWTLLPIKQITQVIDVLEYGAKKYDVDGWKYVKDARVRYKNALARHVSSMLDGEWYDQESGLPHVAHAACNCLFLLWFGE